MPNLLRLTNGVGPGQLVAQVNRLYEWAFGSPLVLPGGVQANGPIVFDSTTATIQDGLTDDPANAGQRLVQINALTVTPGRLYAAGATVNGTTTLNGNETVNGAATITGLATASECHVDGWFRNKVANTGLYNVTGYGVQVDTAGPKWYGGTKNGQLLATEPQLVRYLGGYYGLPSWTIPAAGTWYETPVQVTLPTNGKTLHMQLHGSIISNTVNSITSIGLGIDGGLTWGSITAVFEPVVNGPMTFSVTMYQASPPAAGSHRFSLFLHTNVGSAAFSAYGYAGLWVTEVGN